MGFGELGMGARRIHAELPVFRLDEGERSVLYAPGHLAVVTRDEAARAESVLAGEGEATDPVARAADELARHAGRAVEAYRALVDDPFAPECLIVYPSNACNCACDYCFSRAGRWDRAHPDGPQTVIEEEAVLSAAALVARFCRGKGKPFQLVLHGGGEPTVHWWLVERLVLGTQRTAADAGVEWRGHVATNGVLSAERAAWLGDHFDEVGLSCDGPADIQDRKRPLAGGGPTSEHVERTASVLSGGRARLSVRATITPETAARQEEIVAYLAERLGAREMRFEPAYRVRGSAGAGLDPMRFAPSDAPAFVEHFLAAQRRAGELGCRLGFSGVRLDEVHGPHCNVLRQSLHLLPSGAATACFFTWDGADGGRPRLEVGRPVPPPADLELDNARIASCRRRAAEIPARCRECVNAYHCARECPEACPHDARREGEPSPPGFRCLVAKTLAEQWIVDAARGHAPEGVRPDGNPLHRAKTTGARALSGGDAARLARLLGGAPDGVDVDAVIGEWRAVLERPPAKARSLPRPLWARRGFQHDGERARRELLRELGRRGDAGAVSVYIHVPFCSRRCPFCDCHSRPLGRDGVAEQRYAAALSAEVDLWAEVAALAGRPVTTVHFGGGTPTCLRADVLARLVHLVRARLSSEGRAEWALESTTSRLADDDLARLGELGFSRLHVGVQTLDDAIRKVIGRREPADVALGRIARALERGFVVSADVIYGLPGQTPDGLAATLQRLMAAGVHGVSLYQLQVTGRNRSFLERHSAADRDGLSDCCLFVTAEHILRRGHYRKNHFAHYAREEDENLYYTHAVRGEDLLALGPSADGVFGDYHYRHLGWPGYAEAVPPGLEGGMRESAADARLRPARASLVAGRIAAAELDVLGALPLLDEWLGARLVEPREDGDGFVLTANGSWLLTEMLAELEDRAGAPG